MEVKRWIDEYYSAFLNRYVQKEDYLFTISFAYINFARMEHHFFGALFVNPLLDSRTVREVIDSPWNRETIKCTLNSSGFLYGRVRSFTGISGFMPMELPRSFMEGT